MKSLVSRAWLGWSAAIVALVLAVLGIKSCVDDLRTFPERSAREHMRTQIAEVRAGKRDVISIVFSHEHEMDEFVKRADDMKDIRPFELQVEYSHETDRFLQQIAGRRGIRRLFLGKSDVTSAGMEWVATLPDLEELDLYLVPVTDVGLAKLASAPKLRKLAFTPVHLTSKHTIPPILALPHLSELTLVGSWSDDWLKENLKQLEQAHSLKKLTLVGRKLPPESIQSLREKLPDCAIEIQKHD